MKRFTGLVAMLAFAAGLSLADQWTGWVTDKKCASSGDYTTGDHKRCVEAGQPVVFVNESDKKVYKFNDPEKAKEHIGQKVVLEGTAQGDTIEIQSITPASR